MNYYTEASLADSVIFKSFNNQGELVSLINKCLTGGKIIETSYLEEQIMQIRRTRISPLSDAVLDALEKHDIVLLYSKIYRIPQALPFTVTKIRGKLTAFVFLNNFGNLVENNKGDGRSYFNIAMKDLYVLLEAAYTALSYFSNPVAITKNLGLMKTCTKIYAGMIMRILNKEYALSIDQSSYDKTTFCISRFFLENIWGSTNPDINFAYAVGTILNPNKQELVIMNDIYDDAHIKDFSDLIKLINTISPRLEKLNLRYFTQCYLTTYKASAIFSMECLPYFLYVVEAALIGSFIINQPIISDITKNVKGINTFYAELSKVL